MRVSSTRTTVVLLKISLVFALGAQAQSPFGAPLGPGSVGYRSEWIADETRRFDIPDEAGVLRSGIRYIHAHLWYPAGPSSGKQMSFGDYFSPGEADAVPKFLVDLVHANDFGTRDYSFRGIFRDDIETLNQTLTTRVSARYWAEPSAGKFPVVVHVVGQNDFTEDAALYAEFLASRGYIVVTVPYLGTSARRSPLLVHDPYFYEELLRDIELALTQKALKLKSADHDRIFATGHSYGGIYALLLAMRSPVIKAVVGLDPSYVAHRAPYEYDIRKFPFWDPSLKTPVITLHQQSQSIDRTLLDSLPRAEKVEISYKDVLHGDFTSVAFLRRDLPEALQRSDESSVRSPQQAARNATLVFKQVAQLLDAISAGRNTRDAVLSDSGIEQALRSNLPQQVPSSEDVYWAYRRRGMEAGKQIASRLPASQEVGLVTIAEEEGYYDRNESAVDIFRLVRFAFPKSATAQLAAAKGLRGAGKLEEAREAAVAALQIDPQLSEAKDLLLKLKRHISEHKLEGLLKASLIRRMLAIAIASPLMAGEKQRGASSDCPRTQPFYQSASRI